MMQKLPCAVALAAAGVLFVPSLAAQPRLLLGMPTVAPRTAPPQAAGKTRAAQASRPCGAVACDPATRGVKIAGRDLKAAVRKVAALSWHKLPKARAVSKRTGRPILLLQTLGELDGFA